MVDVMLSSLSKLKDDFASLEEGTFSESQMHPLELLTCKPDEFAGNPWGAQTWDECAALMMSQSELPQMDMRYGTIGAPARLSGQRKVRLTFKSAVPTLGTIRDPYR